MADFPHPAARILVWGGWAVAVELTDPSTLPMLAVASATAFLFRSTRQTAWRLLFRTRWLMLVLFASYAYTLPGNALWDVAGWMSPTREGLVEGGWRVARLALMLVGLAVLLASTARPRLVFGLYVLAAPLVLIGLDRRAFAVRLGLTLDYVDRAPRAARGLAALRSALDDTGEPTRYVLAGQGWQPRDTLVILAALAGVWLAVA